MDTTLLFSIPWIIFYAAMLGFTMKAADLFDEHGMHWFKGDALTFGFLWGLFGVFLVLSREDVANVTVAMVLAFLVRMRLDYRNHAIATAMIVIAFLWKSTFNAPIFFLFFIVFVVFGGLRDYLGDIRQKRDWLFKINEPAWYYTFPTLVYAIFTDNWVLCVVFTSYIVFYNLTKYVLFYTKSYQKL